MCRHRQTFCEVSVIAQQGKNDNKVIRITSSSDSITLIELVTTVLS